LFGSKNDKNKTFIAELALGSNVEIPVKELVELELVTKLIIEYIFPICFLVLQDLH